MKVKVLEVLGPTKFSVRPNMKEGSFHSLQRRLDQHYFDLQSDPEDEEEERIPLREGDSVRSVEYISLVHSHESRASNIFMVLLRRALFCHKEAAQEMYPLIWFFMA